MINIILKASSLAVCLLLAPVATPVIAQQLGVAGSPANSIQDRNYLRLFQTLRQNGIRNYFPTFQYEEVPRAKSLGFEKDFVAPCSANTPSFAALRQTGMKLIIPGELVYSNPGRIGRTTLQNDPLTQIIACAGRENIAGVTNYDEAVFQGTSLKNVAKLYAQVKTIDPTLPVLMVHGPIITDKKMFNSSNRIAKYLQDVIAYSAHSDIVGFDVYPVPTFLSKVATPLSNGANVDTNRVVADYMSWLNSVLPNKRKLMVLQGFAYTDLYEKAFREATVPAAFLATINAPTKAEMTMMLKQARDANVEFVIWWGPAALVSSNSEPWPAILELGRKHGK